MPAKSKSPAAAGQIYQIKLTLLEIKPEIWRRLLVPASLSIAGLHYTIQAAMGWESAHLHAFTIRGEGYGIDYDGEMGFADDAYEVELKDFRFRTGSRFFYEYDFGDSREHELLIEAAGAAEPDKRYPLCIDGERACPPEDCGGAWRYMEILDILATPRHPEKREWKQWLGAAFNPEKFRVDEVNRRLRKLAKTR
jgi:hypothetical protein